jgi:hypothetical protein
MSVRRRTNWISQQRVDVPDMRGLESAVSNDFDELIASYLIAPGDTRVVRGFEILFTGAIGNAAAALQLLVAGGSVLHGGSDQSGTFFVVPDTEPAVVLNSATNVKVVGAFTPSALNYVAVEYARQVDDTTSAPVALWNQANKTETSRNLPRAVTMDIQVRITAIPYAANTLPIAVVETDAANNVVEITDRRPLLLRLGTAGFDDPNPLHRFGWDLHAEGRVESPAASSSNASNPFRGGDKQLDSLKRWMDAVMTEMALVKGTPYWYSQVAAGGLTEMRADLAATVFTGRGTVSHSKSTPGLVNWTGDMYLRFIGGRHHYKIEANPSSSDVSLADGEVAYIEIVRDAAVVPTLVWTNSSTTVTSVGAVPWTADLEPGDFVRKTSDGVPGYYPILTVDSATQVTLGTPYAGVSTGIAGALSSYSFGNYRTDPAPATSRHVKIAAREDVPFGRDVSWLFFRDDLAGSAQEVTQVTALADVAGSLAGKTFLLFDTLRLQQYALYAVVSGDGDDPAIPGYTSVPYAIATNATATTVAAAIAAAATALTGITASSAVAVATISNDRSGFAPDAIDVDSGFGLSTTAQGGNAAVYCRFLGSELEQGEQRQVGDETSELLYTYVGARGEHDATPDYANSLGAYFRNLALVDSESLTKGIKRLDRQFATGGAPLLVHVDAEIGDDTHGTGSFHWPYKTLKKAYEAITDASASKRYSIVVAPGTYEEANDIAPKYFVDIVGAHREAVKIYRFDPTETSYVPLEFLSGGSAQFQNVAFESGLSFDRSGGDPVVDVGMEGCRVLVSLDWAGLGGGSDALSLRDCLIYGPTELSSVGLKAYGSSFFSSLTINDDGIVNTDGFGSASTSVLHSCFVSSLVQASALNDVYVQLYGCRVENAVLVDDQGSTPAPTLHADAVSLPYERGDVTLTNDAVLDRATEGYSVRYDATEPTDWIDGSPADVASALDEAGALSRFFALYKITEHEADADKVRVSEALKELLDGRHISQEVNDRFVDFTGAVIDFTTGDVFEDDGSTPLGVNFAPAAVGVGFYRWYGLALNEDTQTGLNETLLTFNVTAATANGASAATAPLPSLDGDRKIGAVLVFNNAGSLEVVSIRQLGIGGGAKKVLGIQEVPSGSVDGVNSAFNITNLPINPGALNVFLDGMIVPDSEYTFSTPTITFNTPPEAGQDVYSSYLSYGNPATPVISAGTNNVVYHQVTALEEAAKVFALPTPPSTPAHVLVDIVGGTTQQFSVDYTIAGSNFGWTGLGLDGILEDGDVVRLQYFN